MNKVLALVFVFCTVCFLVEGVKRKEAGNPYKKGQLSGTIFYLFLTEVMVSVLWYW